MEITGILKAVNPTEKVSDRFQKREFVVTLDGNTPYPQHCQFQMTQDKCSVLDKYKIGQEVLIQFNLRGREWSGPQGIRYFNTLECWRIDSTHANAPATPDTDALFTKDDPF